MDRQRIKFTVNSTTNACSNLTKLPPTAGLDGCGRNMEPVLVPSKSTRSSMMDTGGGGGGKVSTTMPSHSLFWVMPWKQTSFVFFLAPKLLDEARDFGNARGILSSGVAVLLVLFF